MAFSAGYLSHPLLNNSNNSDNLSLNQQQNTIQSTVDLTSNNKTANSIEAETTITTVASNVDSNTATLATEPQNIPDAIIENIPEQPELNMASTEQKEELKQWAAQHKSELNKLINTHVPNHIADNMFNMVVENNEFLTEPRIKQNPDIDNNWAYNTEQELTSYIKNHTEADKFDLISVSCKQLKCDVLGIEKEAQAWIKIFFSMFKNLPNVNPPDSSGDTTSFSFLNGDSTTSIYYQLKFNPS